MTPAPSRPCTKCGRLREPGERRCRACKRAYNAEYFRRPGKAERKRELNNTPAGKARKAAYNRTPAAKAHRRKYEVSEKGKAGQRERNERNREAKRAYATSPAGIATKKRYNQTPIGRARRSVIDAEWRLRRARGTDREPWALAAVILYRCQLARLIEAGRPDLRGLADPADPTLILAPHRGQEVA